MKRIVVCVCCLLGGGLLAKPPVLHPVKNDVQFTGQFFYPKDIEVPPAMKEVPPPAYPSEWRDRTIEGEAQVAFLINEKGRTEQVQAVTATDVHFATAAIEAVKKWRFKPAKKDGKPARVLIVQTIKFTLGA
ncbi:MAG: energy transducer TonB [Opitutae bacterium]|nr:energy transducer TonB [Opitutae bacterium]